MSADEDDATTEKKTNCVGNNLEDDDATKVNSHRSQNSQVVAHKSGRELREINKTFNSNLKEMLREA